MGSSDNSGMGKSLDDIISDRRKEQAKASSGRSVKDGKAATNTRNNAKEKKKAVADRSVATGRAKRAAAQRARRGLSDAGDKKPSAMEVEKEVYRQSRRSNAAKKTADKKASNGRLPPNSSLREKKNGRNTAKKTNNKQNDSDPPGVLFGRMPKGIQMKAAVQGMYDAGCPVPEGFQLVMQFAPKEPKENTGKGKGNQSNNNNNRNNNSNNRNNSNNNNNNGNQKSGGRRNGRGRKD